MSAIWVGFTVLLIARASLAQAPWDISVSRREVLQGGVVQIGVVGENLAGAKALLRNQEMPFFSADGGAFSLLMGVDLEERAGPMALAIRAVSKDGEKKAVIVTLHVKEKEFPRESLSVPAAFDRIDEATRRRIEREQAQLDRLWPSSGPRRLWQGLFLAPVPGTITSAFGLRRIVNGSARAPHSGVDLKASLGDPIVASNHGHVALREEFFFSGKSLVLDHGGGLYTMYFHLADFHVEKGAQVRKGDLLGRVGMTGRVTGPHLHWGVRLHGARVDPFELLEKAGSEQ